MKDIISVEIERTNRPHPDFPWFVKITSSIFSEQKHFPSLPDALAWVAREVVKG